MAKGKDGYDAAVGLHAMQYKFVISVAILMIIGNLISLKSAVIHVLTIIKLTIHTYVTVFAQLTCWLCKLNMTKVAVPISGDIKLIAVKC